jgi:hypothetical protein
MGGSFNPTAESFCPVKSSPFAEGPSDRGMVTEDESRKHHKDRQDDLYSR